MSLVEPQLRSQNAPSTSMHGDSDFLSPARLAGVPRAVIPSGLALQTRVLR